MKPLAALSLCFLACTARALDTDDLLDRVDTALSVAGFQDNVRLRLSGTIDLEGYHFQQPAPGLIDSNIDNLFSRVWIEALIRVITELSFASTNTPSDSLPGRTDDSLFRSVSSPP